MLAKQEIWNQSNAFDVWIGKYLNSNNLPHWHSDCELITVERGQLDVVCENKTYELFSKDAFFIDSEQIHYMQAKQSDTVLKVIIINYKLIKKLFADRVLACPYLGQKYDADALYETIKDELKTKRPFYDESVKSMITRFFIDILREEKTETRKERYSSSQLKNLLDKIENEFDSITFRDAYEFMAMDEAYFCRYFKKATGMSFTNYLSRVKINNAISRMRQEPSLPVTTVAFACGFGSIRHFNKTFKDLTGYSPKSLPSDYKFDEYVTRTNSAFDPTLKGCTLLEQF